MNQNRNNLLLKLCVTAMMAALVMLGSKLQIQLPAIVGTSRFHLGNVMCALSGLLLGPGWGFAAAGLGSVFFDLFDPIRIAEAPVTLLTKGVYGLVAGLVFVRLFKSRSNYWNETIATLCAAVSYIALYLGKTYLINGLLVGGLTADTAWLLVLEKLPSSVFNGAVAVVFAPVLGVAIHKALHAAHLEHMVA